MTRSRWILVIVAALLTGLLQVTFFSLLPEPFRGVQPVLILCVLGVAINRSDAALVFAAVSGLMIDLFTVGAGFLAFAEQMLVVSAVAIIAEKVLTNRSVYSAVALLLAARIMSYIWLAAMSFFSRLLFKTQIFIQPFNSLLVTMVWDALFMCTIFLLLAFFTRRFSVGVARFNTYDG
ncbi:hypothetical protein KKF59_01520 [Patescibacteria group bacterium]|nr:hypothetical protein [Patescibacteria group bacterium]MBU1907792.1 hypothetical protein [Patescibacteria group bacterium]